jgi:hypothetical protein
MELFMGLHFKRWTFVFALVALAAVHGTRAQTSTDTASTETSSFDPFLAATSTDTTTSDTTMVVTQSVRPPYVPPPRTPYVPPPK